VSLRLNVIGVATPPATEAVRSFLPTSSPGTVTNIWDWWNFAPRYRAIAGSYSPAPHRFALFSQPAAHVSWLITLPAEWWNRWNPECLVSTNL